MNRYRSGLEIRIADQLHKFKKSFTYEEDKIRYNTPPQKHIYTPDFKIVTSSGKEIFIEAKGKWDYKDRMKHLLIREQHPEIEIRFVFSNPRAKIRKGSKTTYEHICLGEGRGQFKGVIWMYAKERIPAAWLKE